MAEKLNFRRLALKRVGNTPLSDERIRQIQRSAKESFLTGTPPKAFYVGSDILYALATEIRRSRASDSKRKRGR